MEPPVMAELHKERSHLYLIPLKPPQDTIDTANIFRFQYFPESISDTKSINWEAKDIPGGSLPLYQWISSGERTISFDAVLASDLNQDKGAAFYEEKGVLGKNVDIRSSVQFLRSFLFPEYATQTGDIGIGLTVAPRKMLLYMQNSGLGYGGGYTTVPAASKQSSFDDYDFIPVIMKSCEVTYEAFFVNGVPRVAKLSMEFGQIAQLGGEIKFPQTFLGEDAGAISVESDLGLLESLL